MILTRNPGISFCWLEIPLPSAEKGCLCKLVLVVTGEVMTRQYSGQRVMNIVGGSVQEWKGSQELFIVQVKAKGNFRENRFVES